MGPTQRSLWPTVLCPQVIVCVCILYVYIYTYVYSHPEERTEVIEIGWLFHARSQLSLHKNATQLHPTTQGRRSPSWSNSPCEKKGMY